MTTVTVPENWRKTILRERERKDEFFADHPHSPIPAADRENFDGLAYYPPDPDYLFELELDEYDEPGTITTETTTDGEREYRRWGEFRFTVDGTDCTLQAYRAADGDDHGFWVPFRDETSAEETYGAGRYLDLDAEEDRTSDGTWVVDFNRAYSPYCAYNDAYECPLVPMENWLEVRIEAGEKYEN